MIDELLQEIETPALLLVTEEQQPEAETASLTIEAVEASLQVLALLLGEIRQIMEPLSALGSQDLLHGLLKRLP